MKRSQEEAMTLRARLLLVVSVLLMLGGLYVGFRVGGRFVPISTHVQHAAEVDGSSASVVGTEPTALPSGSHMTAMVATGHARTDGWTAGTILREEQGVVGKWTRPTDRALARSVGEQIRSGFPSSARLELGPDRSDVLLVTRTEDLGENQGSISGSLEGWPDSTVVLGYADGAVSGTVNLPDEQRSYVINQTEDGTLRVTELDLTNAPQCGEPPPAGGLPLVPPSAVPNS